MNKLYRGDCLSVLRRLPDESVQCCVTSPPYWGLRDYGVAGQLGLEPTPEAYVARMVEVFAEVRRVLRPDGTLWLNIGDSFATGSSGDRRIADPTSEHWSQTGIENRARARPPCPGLKAKDLVGIPWRLAFALQADGYYLRSDIIWHKPNPMPESVRDRPTKAHEYVFLLSKSARYFFDAEAVREPATKAPDVRISAYKFANGDPHHATKTGIQAARLKDYRETGRNIRTVWTIPPRAFRGAHFATFPPALVERCVKAGTSERGCCPQCGKAWERVTNGATYYDPSKVGSDPQRKYGHREYGRGPKNNLGASIAKTLGFRPACTCPAAAPVPCVVLDPFIGSGTTAAVARSLGRDCIGIDLNPKYLTMARARIEAEQKSADASAGSPATRKVALVG